MRRADGWIGRVIGCELGGLNVRWLHVAVRRELACEFLHADTRRLQKAGFEFRLVRAVREQLVLE